MLTELNGKGGCLCELARAGQLRCPLIVRPTSEDVVTGHLFGTLSVLNPRWWLPDFLNRALGAQRFRRQVFHKLRIDVWQKQPAFPRHLMTWDEGATEVDVAISWENPATTVFVEMKYGSALSSTTVNNNGSHGFPSDQLIRNARVGLWQTGWFDEDRLFEMPPRDFVLLLVSPRSGNPLVQQYREPDQLRKAIPHGHLLSRLPTGPFVGELSYSGIIELLSDQRRWFTRAEQMLIDRLKDYLYHKTSQILATDRQALRWSTG